MRENLRRSFGEVHKLLERAVDETFALHALELELQTLESRYF